MAQTLVQQFHGVEGMGAFDKLKLVHLKLTNSAAETTYTLTAALAALAGIVSWFFSDQTAAAAWKVVPTADGTGRFYVSLALTFTAGDTLDIFVIGF